MKFSICIPNYNYERYLGRTLESVLAQGNAELEVVIADNASTDGSVDVVRAIGDPRVRIEVNRCNVGFAGNLDRAARLATGRYMNMLSSDDLMADGALTTYGRLIAAAGDAPVLTSTMRVIDPDDGEIGRIGPDPEIWEPGDIDRALSEIAGADVYRVAADRLLARALRRMRNPFNFAATAYPRELYEAIEGYGGARLINPDKWFHWRLLGVATSALYVDRPLFSYRWHAANQTAQQEGTKALKHLVDEYASTLEITPELLERAGLDRAGFEQAFVDYDIVRHGLGTLARGGRQRARRILRYGQATYPWRLRRRPAAWALGGLLTLGPLGSWLAGVVYRTRRGEQTAW